MQSPVITTPAERAASGRSASTGMSARSGRAGPARRGVTPIVRSEDRHGLDVWKNAYESRFMMTSLQGMHMHVGECVEQCKQTHAEKQEFFTQHTVPTLSWMDLSSMHREHSLTQKQPAYCMDVGGPQRMGVMPRRLGTGLHARAMAPSLSLGSKSGRAFGT